ncbi:hypothetical protein SynA18461_00386 [Synechococcus sp. A18-46.1]|nr:hypothetical protein SynA18461_00386 [Synechococcus sp. A18-46.1]
MSIYNDLEMLVVRAKLFLFVVGLRSYKDSVLISSVLAIGASLNGIASNAKVLHYYGIICFGYGLVSNCSWTVDGNQNHESVLATAQIFF